MFFPLSKFLWPLVEPANLLLGLLGLGALLALAPGRAGRFGRGLLGLGLLAAVTVAVVPLGTWMIAPLENRFPPTPVTDPVDGIIVLGGVLDPALSADRGQVQLGGAADRVTEMVALARRHPDARILYSAGSGDPLRPDLKEAPLVGRLLADMGVAPGRVWLEDQARNTRENAARARELMAPQPGQRWLLVTSAFHMPRAVGVFRAVGWPVIAHPVDYMTPTDALDGRRGWFPGLGGGLGRLSLAVHEWLGLLVYWWTDRMDEVFPAP
ncbi:MAG: YdcF family protein [Rhodobacterales bacterium]|nr:YdcF family protein [Rhodobacterales bacterium]